MLEAFIHGSLLAFGLILPLGVQNVFVFNQGASQSSFLKALPVVITASLCDTLLILLAVLGVSAVVLSFAWLKMGLMLVGVIFLLYMGWTLWRSKPTEQSGNVADHVTAKKQIMFAASVSLLNPHAILDTIGVIGTSSLAYDNEQKMLFTLATILVSWVWFISLAIAGRVIRSLDQTGGWMVILNKISACIVWGTAIYLFIGVSSPLR